MTSNPTIFQKAIAGSADYDEQFRTLAEHESGRGRLLGAGHRRRHQRAAGCCGRSTTRAAAATASSPSRWRPSLAHDTAGTIEAARDLHERIDLPNLMVKIPATAEGVPAIRQMISEGRNINVTLIFCLARYAEVIEAYLSGLEAWVAGGGDPAQVHSVASFFVSRVDTEVDRRLDEIGAKGQACAGKAAVAQAKLAYQLFQERFSGARWEALRSRRAPTASGRCGRRRRPRTRPTPTCSTSTT